MSTEANLPEFRLAAEPINVTALSRGLEHPRAGAVVVFEGRVRNHQDGRAVHRLDYEAYGPLAEREGARIVAEARERFGLLAAGCVHRVGRLAVGDLAVWVGVAAAHRGAAFEGCRWIIDEVKARVPVWKLEHYADGPAEWVNCATRGPHAGGGSPA